jgi:hypothetical protein
MDAFDKTKLNPIISKLKRSLPGTKVVNFTYIKNKAALPNFADLGGTYVSRKMLQKIDTNSFVEYNLRDAKQYNATFFIARDNTANAQDIAYHFVWTYNYIIGGAKYINFVYIDMDEPRMFPKNKGATIGVDNVNGGLTRGSFIFVYRREEYTKVLLHEFIHAIGYDAEANRDKNLLTLMKEIHSQQIIPRECYTEILADIINLGIKCIENPQNARIIEKEAQFALMQTAKILCHFGITHFEDIYNGPWIKESTNVVSYYVLKSAIYFRFNTFLDLLNENGLEYNIIYGQLLCDAFRSEAFALTINKIICCSCDIILEDRNLRMTIDF